MTFETKLDIFEGPLDLLLHLVRSSEIDITDIPIATITDQYLDYLDLMRALDISVAGDFLVMASTLLHLKSKILLPKEEQDLEEIEELREEVFRPLREYLQLMEAAKQLASRDILYRDVFMRGSDVSGGKELEEETDTIRVNLYDLMEAFRKVIKKRFPDVVLKFRAQEWSVKQKRDEVMNLLREKSRLSFRDLFSGDLSLPELIATFLALLELVKQGSIDVSQDKRSGDIRLVLLSAQA